MCIRGKRVRGEVLSVSVNSPGSKVLYFASTTEPQRGRKMKSSLPFWGPKGKRHVPAFLVKSLRKDKTLEGWIDWIAYLGTQDLKID